MATTVRECCPNTEAELIAEVLTAKSAYSHAVAELRQLQVLYNDLQPATPKDAFALAGAEHRQRETATVSCLALHALNSILSPDRVQDSASETSGAFFEGSR